MEEGIGSGLEEHNIDSGTCGLHLGHQSQLLFGIVNVDAVFRQVRVEMALHPILYAQTGIQQHRQHLSQPKFTSETYLFNIIIHKVRLRVRN